MFRLLIISILILIVSFSTSCQSPSSMAGDYEKVFPTPFQETLEPKIVHPTIIVSTSTSMDTPFVENAKTTPTPTDIQWMTTQIFPQVTESYQPDYPGLAEEIDQIIIDSGGRWHIIIKEVNGPTLYTRLTEQRITIASVVKVPVALLFFAALDERGVPEYQLLDYIESTGTGGRTFDQLLSAMLVKSEEDATDILTEYIALNLNIPSQLREWQLQSIDLDARRYTADGVAKLFERLYQGDFVSPTAKLSILRYLSDYTPNDVTRIGTLMNTIPENYQIYNKRGSLLTPYVVADTAILENPNGTDYIIAIFAYNSEQKTTYETLDDSIGEIALVFWKYISSEN